MLKPTLTCFIFSPQLYHHTAIALQPFNHSIFALIFFKSFKAFKGLIFKDPSAFLRVHFLRDLFLRVLLIFFKKLFKVFLVPSPRDAHVVVNPMLQQSALLHASSSLQPGEVTRACSRAGHISALHVTKAQTCWFRQKQLLHWCCSLFSTLFVKYWDNFWAKPLGKELYSKSLVLCLAQWEQRMQISCNKSSWQSIQKGWSPKVKLAPLRMRVKRIKI